MKITHKYIAEVKRELKRQLHPHSWHEFMSTPEAFAVTFAIDWLKREHITSNTEIRRFALQCIKDTEEDEKWEREFRENQMRIEEEAESDCP